MKTDFKPTKSTELSRCIRTILLGSGATLALTAGAPAFGAQSGTTDAANLDALKAQVRTLMGRIDQLEDQQAANADKQAAADKKVDKRLATMQEETETAPANVVTSGDLPGSYKIPGSNTSVSLTGYIKADLIYDVDSDVGDSFAISNADADSDAPNQGHTRLHARQSRLTFQSHSDFDTSSVRTYIEGDFYGNGGTESFSNSTSFRIRHAYGEWDTAYGKFLAGQTWTNYGAFNYVSTVDFFGPQGQVFLRQGQLRYTTPDPIGLSFSIENPETLLITGADPASGLSAPVPNNEHDRYPDITAKWTGGPGGAAGTYNISAVGRQLSGDGFGVDGDPYDDETLAWGVYAGGTWDFGLASFTIGGDYGDGVGRYNLSAVSTGAVAVDGKIETLKQYNVTTGLSIPTGEVGSFNFNVGYAHRDDDFVANFVPEANERVISYHGNYIWTPVAGSAIGLEVVHGNRHQYNGVDAQATRVQLGAQQSF